MKYVSTQAIILKRINFSEADRVLTVLTAESGKMSMLAKGVRKSKSKLAGGLELFSITDINYIDGKSDMKTIISSRLKIHFKNIVSDMARTMACYDSMKAIDVFTQHSDEPVYFTLLASCLAGLNDTDLPVVITEVWFAMQVLQIHGSSMNLEKPLHKPEFSEDTQYDFSYDDMSFYENEKGAFTPSHIKFLRLVVRSNEPKQLTSIVGYNDLSQGLRHIVKQSVGMHRA
jgi:DNA repair protein RecO (recombination protein O)